MGRALKITEWNREFEIWLLPEAACLQCLKAWRNNELSSSFESFDTKELRALIEAQKEAMIVDQHAMPRRIDRLTGHTREHVLNQHPACGRHGITKVGREHASEMMFPMHNCNGAFRRLSTEGLKHAVADLVDSHIGLVRNISELRSDSPMSGASARLRPLAGPQDLEYGHGRSGMPNADRITAVAEAVERWGGFKPWPEVEVVTASRIALGDSAVDPRSFILNDNDPDLSHWRKYDDDTEYEWVWGWSVRRKAPLLVPLQLAYYGVTNPIGGRFVYEISNGCAGGGSVCEAALYGLLEVIERDAFLTSWHSSRPLNDISKDVLDSWGRGLVARLSAEGVNVSMLDVGCGLPGHAVAIEILDTAGRYLPRIVQAAAAHPDPTTACTAALQEAAGMLGIYGEEEHETRRLRAEALLSEPESVLTMHDHVAQGDSPLAWATKAFRRSGHTVVPVRGSERDAHELFEEYARATLHHAADIIIIDQSYSPARDRGLHTVKVLAPGLHSMTFGKKRARLSGDRLALFAPQHEWRLEPHLFP